MFGKEKEPKRFTIRVQQTLGVNGAIQIIVDKKTGVNYLNTLGAGASGLTPLLDENGKVVVTPVKTEDDSE